MNEDITRSKDRSAVLLILARSPPLALRLGKEYLRMRRKANKAKVRFYNALVQSGLPKREAKLLAEQYASALSVRSIIRNLDLVRSISWFDLDRPE